MGYVITSIKIDEDKKELAKQKGFTLQKLMDDALNMALQLEVPGKAQLEVDKENVINQIALLEQQKEAAINKFDKDINTLKLELKYIDKQLAGTMEDQKQLQQKNDYEDIMAKALEKGAFDDALENEFIEYCQKYKLINVTLELNKAKEDLTNRYFNK